MTHASLDVRVGRRCRFAVTLYRHDDPRAPRAQLIRYGSRVIGAGVKLPRSRCLSVNWARA